MLPSSGIVRNKETNMLNLALQLLFFKVESNHPKCFLVSKSLAFFFMLVLHFIRSRQSLGWQVGQSPAENMNSECGKFA